jgi:3-phenylpropionate/trans-cinnamate dioxygenase ferredoxin subunit
MREILLGSEKDFKLHEGKVVVVENEEILVYRSSNKFFAFKNECSHEKFSLDNGIVNEDKESITCIHHGAKFDMSSGKVLSFPATSPIKVFDIFINDKKVYIKID